MKINESSPLFLTNLYFYDITSCYYNIAKSAYYDLAGIDETNKTERNIALGKEQIDNENFQKYLQESADAIVDYYLFNNGISKEDIIVRQRDGFIITKMLQDNDSVMKIDFREYINFMVVSLDRKKFLYTTDSTTTVKGVSNVYTGIEKIYNMYGNLSIYNKKSLFRQLQRIKELVLSGEDLSNYIINKNGKKLLISKNGLLEIHNGIKISNKLIDTQKYYDLYIKEFNESLILNFW